MKKKELTSEQHKLKPGKSIYIDVDKNSIYKCTITPKAENSLDARIVGISKTGERIINRNINKTGHTETIFYTNNQDCSIEIHVESLNITQENNENLYSLCINKIGSTVKHSNLITTSESICAAIATYPPRIKSLLECIESLIEQVDYLLVYLNEYKEIPDEISQHRMREKIICIVDEEGSRRAEAKFHWVKRVNGYYLTCDDDIIYPCDYIKNTIKNIKLNQDKCIVGYHAIKFKNAAASFKADRDFFVKFSERHDEDNLCHVLGTGVSGFHSDLIRSIDISLLADYPYAVDPAFAVICKKNSIPMLCLKHSENWIIPSPYMQYGLHEEKQAFKELKENVDKLIQENNPWGGNLTNTLFAKIKKHKKIRKFFNNPKQFVLDSKILKLIK